SAYHATDPRHAARSSQARDGDALHRRRPGHRAGARDALNFVMLELDVRRPFRPGHGCGRMTSRVTVWECVRAVRRAWHRYSVTGDPAFHEPEFTGCIAACRPPSVGDCARHRA